MSDLFVLHIRSYYPDDYFFEETQYLNDKDNIDSHSGHNIIQYNNKGRNLSTIIYYDKCIDKFVLLTDNITFIINNENNSYSTEHKYNRFILSNISTINLLLSRMASCFNCKEKLTSVTGTYHLHRLCINDSFLFTNISYYDFSEKLTEENKVIYIHLFDLNKNTINDELEMIKHLQINN